MNNPVNPKISKIVFGQYIKQFNFRELFNNMGWDNDRTTQPIVVDNETYALQAVAQKHGFKILTLQTAVVPDYAARKKIENQVTKLFYEHLIIFFDAQKTEQIWQFAVREAGKPTKVSETRWNKSQAPELLYQRASGVFFELDEEEHITIVDVKSRMAENFHKNNEKVTKKFYDGFKKEHTAFLSFITGIAETANQEWYASLMLNRLMFCYFIQKRGFLDNNKNYLRHKLEECKQKKVKGRFYSFYRSFLLVLFHKGLNNPARTDEIQIEIGKIPYLNGGLFDEHELEKNHAGIDIDDRAFENLFNFFDQYEWHLDTRNTASGRDINPDVIGYIFEKYINDRANMGAYYTKEDITDYISKNCIIPYLFENVRTRLKGFKDEQDNPANKENPFNRVKTSGDTYIYDAVKKGVELPLPEEIETGINTALPNLRERRAAWNKPAPADYALPTEIWRETVARRQRYAEVRAKIDNGEICTINDFITYNLNIRQFAQDAIENTNDPEFLKAFYKALTSVTILDPTCGSGAFLFAAMNILEPLYEACIMRMRAFVEDEDRKNNTDRHCERSLSGVEACLQSSQTNRVFHNKYKFFREVLENIQSPRHPNRSYFVYKSIILNNLYGVDIMREAVEIAKLRLFLKLAATVDADYRKPNLGLEPLPDIDFNIRAGNALVGFATEKELENAFAGALDFDNDKEQIKEKCEIAAMAFQRYKEIQLTTSVHDFNGLGINTINNNIENQNNPVNQENPYSRVLDFKTAKDKLNDRLKALNTELNVLLAKQYGITANKQSCQSCESYKSWFRQYQPFHWFAEFYEIINDKGGFDVIIGNPPYVSMKEVNYKPKQFETISCGDLFALTIERSFLLNQKNGKNGFIIPLSALSTDTMQPLKSYIFKNINNTWNSYYSASDQPASLFSGVRHRLLITINDKGNKNDKCFYSTNFYKWLSYERDDLFTTKINYCLISHSIEKNSKVSRNIEINILETLLKKKPLANYTRKSGKTLYYHNAPVYWNKVFDFVPNSTADGIQQQSSHLKSLFFENENYNSTAICLLNSSLFYWFNWQYSNCRDLSLKDILKTPISIDEIDENLFLRIVDLKNQLMNDLKENSKPYTRVSKGITTVFDSFYPALSKPIIDEIDTVLAAHYGFTEEELDFIINYDIKYRMGKELDGDDK